jgi:putative restriction endonuclease
MANWSREQLLVALNLYCQLPFGKFHSKNPIIIETSKLIDRTPSSLAMKLSNLASLDPAITTSGRKGLAGASLLDKKIWLEFQENPNEIGYESQVIMEKIATKEKTLLPLSSNNEFFETENYYGDTKKTETSSRIRQSFFRRSILSSYESRCCMSGINTESLLIASHIVPWSKDQKKRLNPSNGLCLSALHDKAYDQGLITVTPDFKIIVSKNLYEHETSQIGKEYLTALNNKEIILPCKFLPNRDFLAYHNENVFKK